MNSKKNKNKKKRNNKNIINSQKNLFQHVKGIPSSSNWANKFQSIILKNNLIYISNCFVIIIELGKKIFSQILSSKSIINNDRLNVLCSIQEKIFIISNLGKLIIFQFQDNKFIEDLELENKYNKTFKNNIKCFDYIEKKNIIYVSNHESLEVFNIFEDNIKQLISIPFLNENSIITIKHFEYHNIFYLSLGLKNGIIEIFSFENFHNILTIENEKEMIFSLDFINNILFSIDKNGTLKTYKINFKDKSFETILIEKNKYNDKSINEQYLFFSIFCISNNKIIITSTEGRIFIYNIDTKENKELAENPHKASIFSIKLIEQLNQICFISSDDIISFFSRDSLNFLYQINTISKKIKFISVTNNIIYYLIQNNNEDIYLYKYNYTKSLNSLNTIKRKIEEKNEVKEFQINKLKEGILFLRTCLNRIYIYNFENNTILFDNFISDINIKILSSIFIKDNIYLIEDSGNLIKLNTTNKNIIKYNIIDKEIQKIYKARIIPLDFIETDNINIIILYTEDNVYILFSTNFYSRLILKISFKFLPSITLKDEALTDINIIIVIKDENHLKLISINFSNLKINSPKNYQEYINYKENLDKYQPIFLQENFDNFFQKNINLIKLGNNNNFLSCQSDGIVNYFSLNLHQNIINFLYRIRTNFLIINHILFINEYSFVVSSNELCLKIFSPKECILLDVKILSNISNEILIKDISLNKSFPNITSSLFFQQSLQNSKKFSDSFQLKNSLNGDDDFETYIFSYYNNKQLNLDSSLKIVENEKSNLTKNNTNFNYLFFLYQYLINLIFEQKNKIIEFDKKFDLIYEKNFNNKKIINILLQNENFIECILYIKIKNLGIETFLNALEKVKYYLYLKQNIIQIIKIQKIIEVHLKYYNINQ